MKIFLLSGQSILNKDWIEEVEKEFNKEFPNTTIIYYDHWDSDVKNINLERETSKFIDMVHECEEEYLVFAKSMGSVVFYNSIEKLTRKPNGVLMVGVPYQLAIEMGLDMNNLKEKTDFKVNIYQKESDPFGKLEGIRKIEGGTVKVKEYICTGEDNDNHHYTNTKYLLKLMKELL